MIRWFRRLRIRQFHSGTGGADAEARYTFGVRTGEPLSRLTYFETLERRLLASAIGLTEHETFEPQIDVGVMTANTNISIAVSHDPASTSEQIDFNVTSNLSAPLIRVDEFHRDNRFSGIDGSGFSVAILDSGIDLDDPFFGPDANGDGVSDRIVFTQDFTGNGNAGDVLGHGSNVSSIVGSSDPTYLGVAPNVDIIALKVIGDNGSGTTDMLEAGLQWVVAHALEYNIAAVNLSLGDGGNYTTNQSLYGIGDELSALAAMDVMVVAAAGNSFFNYQSAPGVTYPAADINTIAVGAVFDSDIGGTIVYGSGAVATTTGADQITPFSQRHATLIDVFAPGAAITGAGAGTALTTMHGTSQAAPHVTGAAVLAQQLAVAHLGRHLTLSEFRGLLQTTSVTIYDGDDELDNVVNTGLNFNRIDLVSLGTGILDMAQQPEIVVTENGYPIADGTGQLNFGTTTEGLAVTKTLTVSNQGFATLTLDSSSLILPLGFRVGDDFGTTTLSSNQSTTFSIQLEATTTGVFKGGLFFTNNDLDEGTYHFTLSGTVNPIKLVNGDDSGRSDLLNFFPGVPRPISAPYAASGESGLRWPWTTGRTNNGGRDVLPPLQKVSDQVNRTLDRLFDDTPYVTTVSGQTLLVNRIDSSQSDAASEDIVIEV